jgi:hypothetical protein
MPRPKLLQPWREDIELSASGCQIVQVLPRYRSRHWWMGVLRKRSMCSSRVSGQLCGGQFGPGSAGSV